jgi:hypothetical protein
MSKVYTSAKAFAATALAAVDEGPDMPPMRALCKRLLFYIRPGDTFVDLSCGYNEWLPVMAAECRLNRMEGLTFKAFGSDEPRNQDFFTHASWEHLAKGGHEGLGVVPETLIMGLCPPWGLQGSTAKEFMRAVAGFKPRLLVLLIPDSVPLPPGYIMVDRHDQMFQPPAKLPRRCQGRMPQFCFFLLQRRDTCRPFGATDVHGSSYICWDPDPFQRGFRSAAEPQEA